MMLQNHRRFRLQTFARPHSRSAGSISPIVNIADWQWLVLTAAPVAMTARDADEEEVTIPAERRGWLKLVS